MGAAMELERVHLLPMADEGFELEEKRFTTVDKRGCVRAGTNWYSTALEAGPAGDGEAAATGRRGVAGRAA